MIDGRKALAAVLAGFGLAGAPCVIAAEKLPTVVPISATVSVPDVVDPAFRDAVLRVMRQPTISARGSSGDVTCTADQYSWLLDHPDRVALAWKRMRVPCVDISEAPNGKFMWADENGSDLVWQTVGRFPDGLVWYATGRVKATAVMPHVPVRAVVVVTQSERKNSQGETSLRPTAQVYLQTDSRAANLILRMIGPTAPKLAEQGAEQLLFFFNGVANHLTKHPTERETLLAPAKQ